MGIRVRHEAFCIWRYAYQRNANLVIWIFYFFHLAKLFSTVMLGIISDKLLYCLEFVHRSVIVNQIPLGVNLFGMPSDKGQKYYCYKHQPKHHQHQGSFVRNHQVHVVVKTLVGALTYSRLPNQDEIRASSVGAEYSHLFAPVNRDFHTYSQINDGHKVIANPAYDYTMHVFFYGGIKVMESDLVLRLDTTQLCTIYIQIRNVLKLIALASVVVQSGMNISANEKYYSV